MPLRMDGSGPFSELEGQQQELPQWMPLRRAARPEGGSGEFRCRRGPDSLSPGGSKVPGTPWVERGT